jgi:hypothetical protein
MTSLKGKSKKLFIKLGNGSFKLGTGIGTWNSEESE